MPNSPKPARTLLQPGADFAQRAIPVTRQPARVWFRVHRSGSPAVYFGIAPHHRFSHPDSPFPLLYVGATIQTCLWEYFGDDIFQGQRAIPAGKWRGCSLSRIRVPKVKVCGFNLEKNRSVMSVDKASMPSTDLAIPQAWGMAVQVHPAGFQGIKYTSRFIDQPCLALFDREGVRARLKVDTLGSLSDIDGAVDWLDDQNAALV